MSYAGWGGGGGGRGAGSGVFTHIVDELRSYVILTRKCIFSILFFRPNCITIPYFRQDKIRITKETNKNTAVANRVPLTPGELF